ncbi:MAG TPA: hypothetical protein VFO98_09795 [Marmoricola sp.]|jgi:hypothetical protein|nr:hypothetical protein [Marmoricola sp.]
MTYQRLAYDDHDDAVRMQADCVACTAELDVPRKRVDVSAALVQAPSLEYDEFTAGPRKGVITVTEAAAHLAARLHLHLD